METLQLFFISFGFTYLIYPYFIRFMNRRNAAQSVSEYALDSFKQKAKTPTIGGLVFLLVPLVSFIFYKHYRFDNPHLNLLLITYFVYGLIGFVDDVKILIEKNNAGLPAALKFLLQVLFAAILYTVFKSSLSTIVNIPLLNIDIDFGYFYMILVLFMLSGASNGVNLTDGMDGLAGGTVLISLIGFAYISYFKEEILVLAFIVSIMGSLASYLMFNWHPAKIFMGDTGSLPLGAVLAALAMVLKLELVLLVLGAVFVVETICVSLQIFWVKTFKKRLFRYTPIHYSFTLAGHKEVHVVLMFYVFGFISMILGVWLAL